MNTLLLSVDWGTSAFRLRLINAASGAVIAGTNSDKGVASAYASWKEQNGAIERTAFYAGIIHEHIKRIEHDTRSNLANVPVVISGMASSTIGMIELPYTPLPFLLNGDGLQYKAIGKTALFEHDLVIISGARTETDVVRGEETQLVGCSNPEITSRQLFIFPGTHSKHITANAGKASSITTYMTGEFFDLLARKSILRDSVEEGGNMGDPGTAEAFEHGLQDSLERNLLHQSFVVRTNQLFKKFSKTANYFYLSGLLIGTELAQLANTEPAAITITGDTKLAAYYQHALKLLRTIAPITIVDAGIATVAGQLAVYRRVVSTAG